jgi:hypothetical protein
VGAAGADVEQKAALRLERLESLQTAAFIEDPITQRTTPPSGCSVSLRPQALRSRDDAPCDCSL